MLSFNLVALFCTAATAMSIGDRDIYHETWANECCFSLHEASTGKILKEDTDGFLYLGGSEKDAWFCLNLNDNRYVLWDQPRAACFEEQPEWSFKCLDPSPGLAKWSIAKQGSKILVQHDKKTGFKACPHSSGVERLFTDKATQDGCRPITISAKELTGTCNNLA